MEFPIAEVTDRLSIAILKKLRIGKNDEEFVSLVTAFIHGGNDVAIIVARRLCQLIDINDKIWQLEADIRNGKEGKLGLEEVGRRAIEIREWNSKRVAIKNEITTMSEKGFCDVKKDHASE